MKNEFNEMGVKELEKVQEDMQKELADIKFDESLKEIGNPLKKRVLRRSIARAKTILNEYKLGLRKKAE